MADTTTPSKGLLSGLIGDVKVDTKVGLSQNDLTRLGLTVFVAACLVMLAWFTFKKYFK
jgi:hypothetical protein